ncbi:hypothetical protein DICVIV_07757 [Dictyocaulus viviparus]|uniref:EF-hand domain-containing protein n=1 Tax=Dictyocaulus viviparus TaxID=29172 RepID=A0A0D8XV11_DICVI|nr:hypothetical protein DICVIV_07757 [Dictyocaulus viviparus]
MLRLGPNQYTRDRILHEFRMRKHHMDETSNLVELKSGVRRNKNFWMENEMITKKRRLNILKNGVSRVNNEANDVSSPREKFALKIFLQIDREKYSAMTERDARRFDPVADVIDFLSQSIRTLAIIFVKFSNYIGKQIASRETPMQNKITNGLYYIMRSERCISHNHLSKIKILYCTLLYFGLHPLQINGVKLTAFYLTMENGRDTSYLNEISSSTAKQSMNENEIILDSSSDESIVGEQAKKLFEICDKDERGFIEQNDLIRLAEFASMRDIQEIQKRVEEKDLVNCHNKNCKQINKVDFHTPKLNMNTLLQPNDVSLASELASMEKTPYYDPYTEELSETMVNLGIGFWMQMKHDIVNLSRNINESKTMMINE